MWKPCFQKIDRKLILWKEMIPSSTILCCLQLTKSNRMRKETVDQLKAAYNSKINKE